jgi:hypothetical protein
MFYQFAWLVVIDTPLGIISAASFLSNTRAGCPRAKDLVETKMLPPVLLESQETLCLPLERPRLTPALCRVHWEDIWTGHMYPGDRV